MPVLQADARAAPDGSLAPVRAAIPDACYVRSTPRGLAYLARDVLFYALVMGALVVTDAWWLVLPLIVLAGLVVSALFILGHDAAHGALFDSPRLNGVVARAAMLPSLHVQEAWVLGHNRVHHGFTARQGMDFVWHPMTPAEYAALSPMARFRHRVEWSWMGAGAYYLREVWWNKMITFSAPAKWARGIRRDRVLVAGWALFASVGALTLGWLHGAGATGALWMWFKLVIAPTLVFMQVIGWAVYVHHVGPEIRWWPRNEWSRWRGQMESTTILRMPRLLNVFFHNIFVHVPHHVDMRIPWYELPAAAAAIEAEFPGVVVDRPFRLRDYLRTARACKLYDFERGAWLSYEQAHAAAFTA